MFQEMIVVPAPYGVSIASTMRNTKLVDPPVDFIFNVEGLLLDCACVVV